MRDSLLALQNPDRSWSEGTPEKQPPMAIITLGTPHRYAPVDQQ